MEHQEFNGINFYQTNPNDYFRHVVGNTSILMHRYVWEYYNCPIPKGYHIHHRDGNKANNDISNLELIKGTEHVKLHGRLLTDEEREWRRQNVVKNAVPKAVEWHKSETGSEWHKEHIRAQREKGLFKKSLVCDNCGLQYVGEPKKPHNFCSNACKSAFRRKSGVDNIEKTCVICGKIFTSNKYSKAFCCSRSCAVKYQHQKKKEQDNEIK